MNTDKEKLPNHIGKISDPEKRKKVYQEARAGKHKDNKQINAMSHNLIPLNERSPEEAAAIRRKGAEAVNKIKGEKKTAKQILDTILPIYANNTAIINNENIPEDLKQIIIDKNLSVTQYDLLYMSMLYQAQNGNYKAAEFIRDTAGDKPTEKIHNINETISEADRRLIEKLNNRIIGSSSEAES